MAKSYLYSAIILVILLIIGCEKDKTEDDFKPPVQMEIWECHTQTVWHKETVFDELVGKWKWYYSENSWTPGEGSNKEAENTIFEFKKDSVLNVIVDGITVGSSHWIIIQTDPPLFQLSLDSMIDQLNGRILFCDDVVEFDNSYIDGVYSYFKRME